MQMFGERIKRQAVVRVTGSGCRCVWVAVTVLKRHCVHLLVLNSLTDHDQWVKGEECSSVVSKILFAFK